MLLTNWLANVTSRLRKRPVFRSRDRRALRQRWQTARSNQISTTEVLEDRTLLTVFSRGELLSGPGSGTPYTADFDGSAVAVDGNWMVVGAPGADAGSTNNPGGNYVDSGAVYLYRRFDNGTPHNLNDDTWAYQQTLLNPGNGDPIGDQFGASVDIDGDKLIVGATFSGHTAYPGAAFVYQLDDNGTPSLLDDSWNMVRALTRTVVPSFNQDFFGNSVAISGNTAVVGAQFDGQGGYQTGTVYVFDSELDDWSGTVHETKIKANSPSYDARLGGAVDISADGNTIIAGASTYNGGYGAAYWFERNEGANPGVADDTWSEIKSVTGTQSGARYGYSVAIDTDYAVVGVPYFNAYGVGDSGFVAVYSAANNWNAYINLTANNNGFYDIGYQDHFGSAVAVSGDIVVVGSPENDYSYPDAGSVYIFDVSNSSNAERVYASHNSGSGSFGTAVSVSGSTIVGGAPNHAHNYAFEGAAFVYEKVLSPNSYGSFTVDGDFILNAFTSNVSISYDSGTGLITITDPDNILQAPVGSTLVDVHTISFPASTIPAGRSIIINGSSGDNYLNVDTSLAASGINVIYNGGGGAGFDSLGLTGSATDVEYRYDSASDGGVRLNGSGTDFITYTGLEPVASTITATNVTLNYVGGAETITVTSAGAGLTNVISTLGETTTFSNPTASLTINTEVGGGSGADTVNIQGVGGGFSANLIVNAGTDDAVNFQTAATNVEQATWTSMPAVSI
ncbi:hypothetical protein F1728_05305 [Gimesia benthica]|uniref:Uncharacterized protein n=1 Tax=Gimesia benthica TaxID=2608982 RepID=A0A6I6A7N1_9PLAN|nr:FG-GAP repeat protein [Gimesia benthica]QGQ22143.1 hypothetical protein F1728_05305 [Gimesia benthica]